MIERALELVASRLNQHLKVRLQSDEDPVVVTSVVATDGSPAQAIDDKLALFIVNIEKETVSKVPPPRMVPGERFATHREPLRLNMLVMLAAGYSEGNYLQALKHISMAMRFLQANAVFDHRNAPEMDPGLDRVVLEVQNLPTQELSHLWGVFGGRYLPSMLYTMRTVFIVPDAIDGTAEPIAEPGITLAVGGGAGG